MAAAAGDDFAWLAFHVLAFVAVVGPFGAMVAGMCWAIYTDEPIGSAATGSAGAIASTTAPAKKAQSAPRAGRKTARGKRKDTKKQR